MKKNRAAVPGSEKRTPGAAARMRLQQGCALFETFFRVQPGLLIESILNLHGLRGEGRLHAFHAL